MPDKKLTLNRFPLFGLFAYRAAKKLGYHIISYLLDTLCPIRSALPHRG